MNRDKLNPTQRHFLRVLEQCMGKDVDADDCMVCIPEALHALLQPPKCTCEVYNVFGRMGDIAIDTGCPFHGGLA